MRGGGVTSVAGGSGRASSGSVAPSSLFAGGGCSRKTEWPWFGELIPWGRPPRTLRFEGDER